MIHNLVALALIFGHLSLLAVGGMNTILPELQRQVVVVHGWMGPHDFAALFALAQAAPGPNMLVSTLIGWHVAGLAGALVATASVCAPPCLLAYGTARVWYRFRHARWRVVAQAGLTPVTVGMILAGAYVLARTTSTSIGLGLVTLVCTAVFVGTRLNPLWLLGAAAALGAAGLL